MRVILILLFLLFPFFAMNSQDDKNIILNKLENGKQLAVEGKYDEALVDLEYVVNNPEPGDNNNIYLVNAYREIALIHKTKNNIEQFEQNLVKAYDIADKAENPVLMGKYAILDDLISGFIDTGMFDKADEYLRKVNFRKFSNAISIVDVYLEDMGIKTPDGIKGAPNDDYIEINPHTTQLIYYKCIVLHRKKIDKTVYLNLLLNNYNEQRKYNDFLKNEAGYNIKIIYVSEKDISRFVDLDKVKFE